MKMRDYQQHIYIKTIEALEKGKSKIIVQLAGGAGKTFLFSKVLENYTSKNLKQAIFLTPRINLSKQTHKAKYGYYQGSSRFGLDKDVIIGNIQTYAKNPLKTVDIVLFDECHMVDKTANDIMKKNPDKIYIAISATPYNGAGQQLNAFKDFYEVEHPYDENYLIKHDYLTPMKYYKIQDTEEFESELEVSNITGDFTDESLKLLEKKGLFDDIVSSVTKVTPIERLKREGLLVVTHSQAQAKKIYEELQEAGLKTGLVISDNKRSMKDLTSFSKGELEAIVSVDMVGTGTDVPRLTHIVLARAFRHEALYRQVVYRGDRKFNNKPFFYVYDFGGNWERLGDPFKHPNLDEVADRKKNKKPKCEACGCKDFDFNRFDDLEEGVKVSVRTCKACGNQEISTKRIDGVVCDSCSCVIPLASAETNKTHFIFRCDCGNIHKVKKSVKSLELVTKERRDIIEWSNSIRVSSKYKDDIKAFFLIESNKNINFVYNAVMGDTTEESKKKVLIKAIKRGRELNEKMPNLFVRVLDREENIDDRVLSIIREETDVYKIRAFLSHWLHSPKATKGSITKIINKHFKEN